MWRQADTYAISMNGADHESVTEIHDKLGTPPVRRGSRCPPL